MPLYIYRCQRCGTEIEELQKFEDPPPVSDGPCPYFAIDDDDPGAADLDERHTQDPCNFERVPSAGHFDFPHATLSNVGKAGWQQHGSTVYRQIQGK